MSAAPTCPTEPTWLDSDGVEHPHTIMGCGSANVVEDDSEPGTFDCLDCGIWFTPARERARKEKT